MQATLHEETAFARFQLCKNYLESGDKAGKTLALWLQQMENKHSTPALYDCNGYMSQEFYSNLYKSEFYANIEDMDTFFNDISLPTLKINEKETLEAYVLETEVKSAITVLPTGKTPGEDGYNIEFYEDFQDILAPLLCLLCRSEGCFTLTDRPNIS